jgi:hypothetical protein
MAPPTMSGGTLPDPALDQAAEAHRTLIYSYFWRNRLRGLPAQPKLRPGAGSS